MLCTNTHPQSSISFVSYARDVSYQYSHEVVVYHVPKLDVIVWLGTYMGPDMWWCRHIIIWLFKHIMALISYCKNDSRTDVKAIGTSLDLETWNMANVIALSMKIYCTDQCLVHCQYLDRLINHYPISMMYGSIAQQITKMVCVIAWLKGSCCTCSKWLFVHENIYGV